MNVLDILQETIDKHVKAAGIDYEKLAEETNKLRIDNQYLRKIVGQLTGQLKALQERDADTGEKFPGSSAVVQSLQFEILSLRDIIMHKDVQYKALEDAIEKMVVEQVEARAKVTLGDLGECIRKQKEWRAKLFEKIRYAFDEEFSSGTCWDEYSFGEDE